MSPQTKAAIEELSLPSFRASAVIKVRPLNFGGVRAILASGTQNKGDAAAAMLIETLKREFPDVTETEVNELEQEDLVLLLSAAAEANRGLSKMGFTSPTSTDG